LSGHVFISYSRKDIEYVNRLYDWLVGKGFNVWQDVNQIEPGEQWPQGIEDALEKCGAFIVVMTPNSKQTEAVQNELLRAKRKKKQVFPLLLVGDEPWLLLENTQWEDVRTNILPGQRFISRLSKFATQSDISYEPPKKEEATKKKLPQTTEKKRTIPIIYPLIIASIFIALAIIAIGNISSAFLSLISSTINSTSVLIFWGLLLLAIILYTNKGIKEGGIGKGLYLGAVTGLIASLVVFIIYFPLPQILVFLSRYTIEIATIRWIIIYLFTIFWSYGVIYKKSGWRGVYSLLILLTTFLLGWLYGQWIGILAMSMPTLIIFIYFIHKLAQVIFPSSNSDDRWEQWQKTQIFIAYLLGIQYPLWIAQTESESEFDMRIIGDSTKEIGGPGFIWTMPHQVTAISNGSEFKIVGPGTIFTGQFEFPITLVDLRKQLRLSIFTAETKDKIKVSAVVMMDFAIDRDKWPKKEWKADFALKLINNFEYNFDLDHQAGSYPFSSNRISVALKKLGIYDAIKSGNYIFHWDREIIKQVENTVCQALEERYSYELWPYGSDKSEGNTPDFTSMMLMDILTPKLAEFGVNLFDILITGYKFEPDSDLARENIKTWNIYWMQQVENLQIEIESIYVKEIEKARTDVATISTSVFTEAVDTARTIDPILSLYLVANYYIHMLESQNNKQLNFNDLEAEQSTETIKNILRSYETEDNE